MDAIAVLFAGKLRKYAFEPLTDESALGMTLRKAASFADVSRVFLLAQDDFDNAALPSGLENLVVIKKPRWSTRDLLETLVDVSQGSSLIYYAWADTPLLDRALAVAIKQRLAGYSAEYAYADGWPSGLAPELLLPRTASVLLQLAGSDTGEVDRTTLFSVLQKDINSFDIETEISPVDLRSHRLNFAADSKRNLLLIQRALASGWTDYTGAERFITGNDGFLRTLPAYFPVMVSAACPHNCALCPWTPAEGFMTCGNFTRLLDAIVDFAGEAVISLSLWGEIALHPERLELIHAVLKRRELSLVIETCGIGWQNEDIAKIASFSVAARTQYVPALSWIVSLDSADPARYRQLHGADLAPVEKFTDALLEAFPGSVYAQALRCKDAEDDIEAFYKHWQQKKAQVIIQKYDAFDGLAPDMRCGDISPITRLPCWHIMRDMPILLDGSVVPCRQGVMQRAPESIGNAFTESLETIWERGKALYKEHCARAFTGACAHCDEYYTYNF